MKAIYSVMQVEPVTKDKFWTERVVSLSCSGKRRMQAGTRTKTMNGIMRMKDRSFSSRLTTALNLVHPVASCWHRKTKLN